jgi:cytosine deaminase
MGSDEHVGMGMTSVLRNARIDDGRDLYDIHIRDGLIQEVARASMSGSIGPDGLDLEGRVCIPAFVNSHTHLDKSFLPETATNVAVVQGRVTAPMVEAKRSFTEADVYHRAERVVLEAIASGTTAIRTHVDVDPIVGLTSVRALLALKEAYAADLDLQIFAFPQEGLVGDTVKLIEEACELGVDGVGGKPGADDDWRGHIDAMFDIALRFDRDVDMHADIDVDRDLSTTVRDDSGVRLPADLEALSLAQKADRHDYQRRVTASHFWAFDSLEPEIAVAVGRRLAAAGISVISCPGSALYLVGRNDGSRVRRGVTRARELDELGVPTAFATDNICDGFNAYGRADMTIHALLAAISHQMTTIGDLWKVIKMGTETPSKILRLPVRALRPGSPADLVVYDASSLYDAITTIASRHLVIRAGRIVSSGGVLVH